MDPLIEPISFTVRHEPRDHRRSIRANRRPVFIRNRIVGACLCLAGVTLLYTSDSPLQIAALIMILVGLVMLARSWLLPWAIVRHLPPSHYVAHQIDIDDQGIRRTAPHTSVAMSWSGFSSARRTRHVWILSHKDYGPPTMIARRHLTNEQETLLSAMLRDRRLLAEP